MIKRIRGLKGFFYLESKNQVNQGSDDCVHKDRIELKMSNSTPLQKYNIMN